MDRFESFVQDSLGGVAGKRCVAADACYTRLRRLPIVWAQRAVEPVFRALHAFISAPALLFLATLAIMLFRPPDLNFYDLDRVAFLLLVFVVLLRILLRRDSFHFSGPVLVPMFAMTVLAFAGALSRSYEPQVWSVLAAKWLVPLTMFWLAGHVFEDPASQRKLEIFFWIVLAYLSLIAVLFLLNADSFIFPKYILNQNLGIHAERARGPFLQAVANGVAISLLGLFALDSFRRRRLPAWIATAFFVLVPIAILATKTRAVWLSFTFSIVLLWIFSADRRIRLACVFLVMAGIAASLLVLSTNDQHSDSSVVNRLQAASPVEFRRALYEAGWEMFLQKPLLGWPAGQIQPEIEKRISEFHQEAFYFHNTFLEVAVSNGILGLSLYVWIFIDLLGLRRSEGIRLTSGSTQVFDAEFRRLWPLLVMVYVLNACFVVMNYQFVNVLLFTLAGILAAQNRHLSGGRLNYRKSE